MLLSTQIRRAMKMAVHYGFDPYNSNTVQAKWFALQAARFERFV